jgi:hypothetical protein
MVRRAQVDGGRFSIRRVAGLSLAILVLWAAGGGAGAPGSLLGEELQPPPAPPRGVTLAVERSIAKGLEFLAGVQRPNGSYVKGTTSGGYRNRDGDYPTAMSALVGLAFIAGGGSPTRGPHAAQVRKISDYLLRQCAQRGEGPYKGLICDLDGDEERYMYSHAFAMTFLAHCYGQEESEEKRNRIREALRLAVDFSRSVQTDDGGWGYTGNHYEDEGTLTVTQLQGLRSCRNAGIFVPRDVIDRAVNYIEKSTNSNGSVRYRPSSSQVRQGVTCAAVVTLWSAGRYEDPLLKRISSYVERNIQPQFEGSRRGHHEYVMYYLSQARFVLGTDWTNFYKRYSSYLLSNQNSDGSWEGSDGGDVYGTAIALLALQLPYNRVPIYQR